MYPYKRGQGGSDTHKAYGRVVGGAETRVWPQGCQKLGETGALPEASWGHAVLKHLSLSFWVPEL